MCVNFQEAAPPVCNFVPHHWADMTHLIGTKAHKHVFQQVLGLQYQSKDWVYFVYVFQRCVQIFKRPLNLYVLYFPHHWADTTHPIGTQGAQTRIARSSCATISK